MTLPVKNILQRNTVAFVIYSMLAAFITYTAMYGIRQPFKAASYEHLFLFGIPYKTVLLITQVLGYMISKFIGIRLISEMKKKGRVRGILICSAIALSALFLFAVTPYPYNFIWLFFNGLPLGLIFGMVFSFLEGRKTTELLSVGLASSIIISSGYAKSTGKWIMETFGVADFWMPFLTGCIFLIPLMVGCRMLSSIPPPDETDKEIRAERTPMTASERKDFLRRFALGLFLLISVYITLTILRDFRDGFIVEIWKELGYSGSAVLTTAEMPVAFGVLLLVGLTVFIKRNDIALWMAHLLILAGGLIIISATILFQQHFIGPLYWMILVGFGLFLGYIMYNTILFERLIAAFRIRGNIGYVIYLADSFGYLGSVAILIYKEAGNKNMSFLDFFTTASYLTGLIVILCTSFSCLYFYIAYKRKTKELKQAPVIRFS